MLTWPFFPFPTLTNIFMDKWFSLDVSGKLPCMLHVVCYCTNDYLISILTRASL